MDYPPSFVHSLTDEIEQLKAVIQRVREAIDDARGWSESLNREIKDHAYDCECQIGGVDAMSVDTDWLEVVALKFENIIKALDGEQPDYTLQDLPDVAPEVYLPILKKVRKEQALDGEQ